ncbi:hypothetical protein QN277_021410 [Acacia crassicarpa]|uniref:Uncharacterized protein n=1 Tax=Acacia crassicarpa TaxID=499986 RepID=A0AAE1MQH1_9FABA|nr:hypothetical protein QN277_021410 [Acacia crassicarpa]
MPMKMQSHCCTGYFRGQKMEGDEGLNTVECLRGRLLAERQASRVANEEAESMGNKLVELEKKLRDEIELREKAEKKLKKLKKKLQSLKLFPISEESVQLSSPEKSESSCCRSPASCSASRDSEVKTPTTNSSLSENTMHIASEPSVRMANGYDSQGSDNSDSDFSSHQNSNSQVLKNDESSSTPRSSSKDSSFQDFNIDECRLSRLGSKSSMTEHEDDGRDYKIDNSLALVPVDFPIINTEARKVKPVHESVVEALDALRHAREKLLCSMGTRHMIQVGPT